MPTLAAPIGSTTLYKQRGKVVPSRNLLLTQTATMFLCVMLLFFGMPLPILAWGVMVYLAHHPHVTLISVDRHRLYVSTKSRYSDGQVTSMSIDRGVIVAVTPQTTATGTNVVVLAGNGLVSVLRDPVSAAKASKVQHILDQWLTDTNTALYPSTLPEQPGGVAAGVGTGGAGVYTIPEAAAPVPVEGFGSTSTARASSRAGGIRVLGETPATSSGLDSSGEAQLNGKWQSGEFR
ncbi:hypothetical protein KIPB_003102 [Kipferlia bialata]|uniref:Uncharacterized protein n=1 Tax=Kipferlia bialata TaxID=797122 RepID=A0A9K3GH74_9EUKA|nr:hypothetical protein KIPB_003102 [Kipferlia bialata]|eukprot:g3102.t1